MAAMVYEAVGVKASMTDLFRCDFGTRCTLQTNTKMPWIQASANCVLLLEKDKPRNDDVESFRGFCQHLCDNSKVAFYVVLIFKRFTF